MCVVFVVHDMNNRNNTNIQFLAMQNSRNANVKVICYLITDTDGS